MLLIADIIALRVVGCRVVQYMLPDVAVCCSVLQCFAIPRVIEIQHSMLQIAAIHALRVMYCSVLQCVAVCCSACCHLCCSVVPFHELSKLNIPCCGLPMPLCCVQ